MKRILVYLILSVLLTGTACASNRAQSISFLLSQVRTSTTSLANGKVYFYKAGTSTLQNVWIDRNKATLGANPYTLDANGTAQLYGDGVYRIVIKDAAGATRFDRDNLKYTDGDIGDIIYDSLTDAVTSLGSTKATLVISEDITLTNSLTIPATIEINPINGATITIPSGKTLTINGPFSAGAYQVFMGSGSVIFGSNTSLVNLPIWGSNTNIIYKKQVGDSYALIDWQHSGNTDYLMHLHTGVGFDGSGSNSDGSGNQALIALGVGDGSVEYGKGMLVSNKRSGTGVLISNEPSITTSGAYGLHALSNSTLAPLVLLEQVVTNSAPALQIAAPAAAASGQVLLETVSTSGGNPSFAYRTMRHYADTGNFDFYKGVKIDGGVLKVTGPDNATQDVGQVQISAQDGYTPHINLYRATGGANTYSPWQISPNIDIPDELVIATGARAGLGAESYTDKVIRAVRSSGSPAIGFLGADPVNRQTATDLESLLVALRNLGLIN